MVTEQITPTLVYEKRDPDGSETRITVADARVTGSEKVRSQEDDPGQRQLFDVLSEWWHEATDPLSSLEQKTEHRAYRRIVEMGEAAVPYILEELRERGGHWDLALEEITNEHPSIPDGFRENIRGVREAWIRWGTDRENR